MNIKRYMTEGSWHESGTGTFVKYEDIEPLLARLEELEALTVPKIVARCSGCGEYTTDRRALTGCAGYCQDSTGKSCNAIPCPKCGRFHYWSGSFEPPRPRALREPESGRRG